MLKQSQYAMNIVDDSIIVIGDRRFVIKYAEPQDDSHTSLEMYPEGATEEEWSTTTLILPNEFVVRVEEPEYVICATHSHSLAAHRRNEACWNPTTVPSPR